MLLRNHQHVVDISWRGLERHILAQGLCLHHHLPEFIACEPGSPARPCLKPNPEPPTAGDRDSATIARHECPRHPEASGCGEDEAATRNPWVRGRSRPAKLRAAAWQASNLPIPNPT